MAKCAHCKDGDMHGGYACDQCGGTGISPERTLDETMDTMGKAYTLCRDAWERGNTQGQSHNNSFETWWDAKGRNAILAILASTASTEPTG